VCWPGSFTTECCSRARVGGLLNCVTITPV
jgi:hypothetical protein